MIVLPILFCYSYYGDCMEIYYTNDKLYISITDSISFSLVSKLKKKLYHILDIYKINNIEIDIENNDKYDESLIDELIKDYDTKYKGIIIVK